MKPRTATFFVFLLWLTALATGFAQINDPAQVVRQKTEQKANAKLNSTIDKGLDTAFDLILGGKKKAKNKANQLEATTTLGNTTQLQVDEGEAQQAQQTTNDVFGKMGQLLDFDAKPKNTYLFSSSILQKMTTTRKGKTDTGYMKLLINKGQPTLGITFLDANKVDESSKGTLIMDLEQLAFFMFNTDKKGRKTYFGMNLKQPNEANHSASPTATSQPPVFTPTGARKTIMGYVCEGYSSETERGDKTIYWVAKASPAGLETYQKAMQQYNAQQPAKSEYNNMALAYFMKQGKGIFGTDFIAKDGNKLETELAEINPNDSVRFDASAFQSGFSK